MFSFPSPKKEKSKARKRKAPSNEVAHEVLNGDQSSVGFTITPSANKSVKCNTETDVLPMDKEQTVIVSDILTSNKTESVNKSMECNTETDVLPMDKEPTAIFFVSNILTSNKTESVKCKRCTASNAEIAALRIENDMLKNEVARLRQELDKAKTTFSFSQIEEKQDLVQYYTGLPDAKTVRYLEEILSTIPLQYHSDWNVSCLPLIDQIFLTLMKLRLNLGHVDLATRFHCSTATVTNIFLTIVSALHDVLFLEVMDKELPSREKNQTGLPACFEPFPNCRIVLDCTEISVCSIQNMNIKSHLYSNYKSRTTLKSLVGVSPNGVITYVSKTYGGSTSDRAITEDCGILPKLECGDTVLADKGFTIRDLLPPGVSLNIPAFLVNGQFTEQENGCNNLITQARIHVERCIQRIKIYTILDFIPHQFMKIADKLLQVCACLANLQTPVMKEVLTKNQFWNNVLDNGLSSEIDVISSLLSNHVEICNNEMIKKYPPQSDEQDLPQNCQDLSNQN